eukprot:1098955-Rhodomonas_salina.2
MAYVRATRCPVLTQRMLRPAEVLLESRDRYAPVSAYARTMQRPRIVLHQLNRTAAAAGRARKTARASIAKERNCLRAASTVRQQRGYSISAYARAMQCPVLT